LGPVSPDQQRALSFGVVVHLVRFGIIVAGLWLAPLVGITGWYMGLFVNVLCGLYAAALMTHYGLWRASGILTLWRGGTAAALVLVLLAEALFWILPDGLDNEPPGFALWGLTLLLVGFNEELISRGVVLSRQRRSFSAVPAVLTTAALFGLQHLSAFATSDRGTYDIVTNVLVSATYGFALAAFQYRFAWIWPLVLIHSLADFTTILTRSDHGDLVVAGLVAVFVVLGVVILRGLSREGASGEDALSPHPHGRSGTRSA